jgi:hypothetical protein
VGVACAERPCIRCRDGVGDRGVLIACPRPGARCGCAHLCCPSVRNLSAFACPRIGIEIGCGQASTFHGLPDRACGIGPKWERVVSGTSLLHDQLPSDSAGVSAEITAEVNAIDSAFYRRIICEIGLQAARPSSVPKEYRMASRQECPWISAAGTSGDATAGGVWRRSSGEWVVCRKGK